MKCTYRSVGFLASALVHLAGVAALLPQVGGIVQAGAAETPLAVSLAMFQPVAPPAPAEPEPLFEPRAEPEPVVATPVPELPPEVPSLALAKVVEPPPPRPRPVRIPKISETPKPKPKPRPIRPRITERPIPPPRPAAQVPVDAARIAPASAGHPVSAAPVSAPAPAQSSARQDYLSALVQRIHQKKYYPRRARRRREEGEALVAFVIDRSGQLSDVRVTRSSGYDSLDRAAIKTLKKISPFRELPAELGMSRWELAVPVAFDLRP